MSNLLFLLENTIELEKDRTRSKIADVQGREMRLNSRRKCDTILVHE